jgi:hypothetical protein
MLKGKVSSKQRFPAAPGPYNHFRLCALSLNGTNDQRGLREATGLVPMKLLATRGALAPYESVNDRICSSDLNAIMPTCHMAYYGGPVVRVLSLAFDLMLFSSLAFLVVGFAGNEFAFLLIIFALGGIIVQVFILAAV